MNLKKLRRGKKMSTDKIIKEAYKNADFLFIYECTNEDCDKVVHMTMKEKNMRCPRCGLPLELQEDE